MATTLDLPPDGESRLIWPEKFRVAIRAVRDTADRADVRAEASSITLYWNTTTDTWPARSASVAPVIWYSLNDASAPPPPGAILNDLWWKRDS